MFMRVLSKKIAILKREEGIGRPLDLLSRSRKLRDYSSPPTGRGLPGEEVPFYVVPLGTTYSAGPGGTCRSKGETSDLAAI